MKNLYIIRHSKAVEHASDGSDFSRCLAEPGIKKANIIAQYLARDLEQVDLILSSPACRALETARIFATALKYEHSEIETDYSLYHFGGIERAQDLIASVNDEIDTLILFGHNPTFSSLAWSLCREFQDGMPTSAVAGVALDIKSWADIYTSRGKLLCFLTKSNLAY